MVGPRWGELPLPGARVSDDSLDALTLTRYELLRQGSLSVLFVKGGSRYVWTTYCVVITSASPLLPPPGSALGERAAPEILGLRSRERSRAVNEEGSRYHPMDVSGSPASPWSMSSIARVTEVANRRR